jgi:hypothetical protein
VEGPPERRRAVRRADALVHVPEFGVPESLQDFLEAGAYQSVTVRKRASFFQKNFGRTWGWWTLNSRGACCLASGAPAGWCTDQTVACLSWSEKMAAHY